MPSKADYVRSQDGEAGDHTCHYPGCGKPCKPAYWGCRSCWFKLPDEIRKRIWKTYRPGQEVRKDPSDEYLVAAAAADAWVRTNDPMFKRQGELF